jgi:antitoxin VapB
MAMTAQLNIKSEDAWRLASRLSELTGESLTAVVTRALRAELMREGQAHGLAARKARLLALAEEISANVKPGAISDHGWLYDENTGLPE